MTYSSRRWRSPFYDDCRNCLRRVNPRRVSDEREAAAGCDAFGAPALLPNRPHEVPDTTRKRIHNLRERFDRWRAGCDECRTGEKWDTWIAEAGVERTAGPHCDEVSARGA